MIIFVTHINKCVWTTIHPLGHASSYADLLGSLNKHLLQELEPKLMDLRSAGSAGITASTKTLSITVRRSKEGN